MKLLLYSFIAWEKFVELLSRPIIWLSELLSDLADNISEKISEKVLSTILYGFLAVEIVVFVIYAIRTADLVEIIKNFLGCTVYGGYVDCYDILIEKNDTGIHLWITSGLIWLLGIVVGKLAENSGQPGILPTIHTIVFTLFCSALVAPVYPVVSEWFYSLILNVFSGGPTLQIVLSAIPLAILGIFLLFCIMSGLWCTVATCYDVACFMLFFFICWALDSRFVTSDAVALPVIAVFLIGYAVLKHFIAKEEPDEYESISIFHYLLSDAAEDSTFLSIVFFIQSLFGLVVFFNIVMALFFPAFYASITS